ncbi:MAG: hypothetical protein N3A54_00070 [Patescibacteria group bacterium]|nr:hypothetical protein [Patescibacteria group bacterium]
MKLIKTIFIIGAFLLAGSLHSKAQWREFVDVFGKQVPFSYDPVEDLKIKGEFFKKARPAYEKYSNFVLLELHCRNFTTITFGWSDALKNPLYFSSGGKVQRGGMTYLFSIDVSTPFRFSPKQFVDVLEKDFEEKREMLQNSPWMISNKDYFWNIEVLNWRELFLYEIPKPKCEVVFIPGQTCTLDFGASSVGVKLN